MSPNDDGGAMMKRRSGPLRAAALALALAWFTSAAAQAQCLTPRGDINGDGTTNILDIQCGIFVSLTDPAAAPPACLAWPTGAADIDCDGEINVTDMLIIVQLATELPLAPQIDADGDACPDACRSPGALTGGLAIATGTSAGPSYTLHALGADIAGSGGSVSPSFALRPLAMGAEPGTGE
jgi:hypothetical protein